MQVVKEVSFKTIVIEGRGNLTDAAIQLMVLCLYGPVGLGNKLRDLKQQIRNEILQDAGYPDRLFVFDGVYWNGVLINVSVTPRDIQNCKTVKS